MSYDCLILLLASFACTAIAGYFTWTCYVPILRAACQVPVYNRIKRMREIGFQELLVRELLFIVELSAIVILVVLACSYFTLGLGIVIAFILFNLRNLVLDWIIDRRENLLRSQTLRFASELLSLARTGLNLSQALHEVTLTLPDPMRSILTKAVNDYSMGRPLIDSLNAVRQTTRLDSLSLLITSLVCSHTHGSSLENTLLGTQESLEHHDSISRQIRAKTSNSRMTILILALTPPGFIVMFWLMMPESIDLFFFTTAGKNMLACIALLMYGGISWSKSMLLSK